MLRIDTWRRGTVLRIDTCRPGNVLRIDICAIDTCNLPPGTWPNPAGVPILALGSPTSSASSHARPQRERPEILSTHTQEPSSGPQQTSTVLEGNVPLCVCPGTVYSESFSQVFCLHVVPQPVKNTSQVCPIMSPRWALLKRPSQVTTVC